MNKVEAIRQIIYDARKGRSTRTNATYSFRACRALGLNSKQDIQVVLDSLDHHPKHIEELLLKLEKRHERA